jgi:hypothetical protein
MPAVSKIHRLTAKAQCRVAGLAIIRQVEVVKPSQVLANTAAHSISYPVGLLNEAPQYYGV